MRDDEDDIDDEDEESEPVRDSIGRLFFAVMKWLSLSIGCFFALLCLFVESIKAGPIIGIACFLGIFARICQAEEHLRLASRSSD